MLGFLKENFGINGIEIKWSEESKLPLYLRKGRSFKLLQMDGEDVLLVKVNEEDFKVSAYLKQLEKLSSYWNGQIILEFGNLSSYQRKTLIENRVSFIVPGSQVYVPFLGMLFKENSLKKQMKKGNGLSSASQMILLYLIDKGITRIRQTDLTKLVNASPMKVSRAVNELVNLNLLQQLKRGRESIFEMGISVPELYKKCSDVLENPICRKVYLKESDLPKDLPIAGEAALARYSMLNPPSIPCYAMWRTEFNRYKFKTIDPNWEDEKVALVELWMYDSKLFVKDGAISEIPLKISLNQETDERVEGAVEEMMEKYRW